MYYRSEETATIIDFGFPKHKLGSGKNLTCGLRLRPKSVIFKVINLFPSDFN